MRADEKVRFLEGENMERFKSITSSDVVHAVLKLRTKWKDRCIEEYKDRGVNDDLFWLCDRKEAMTEGMYELMYELGCIPISELCELNHRCCDVFDAPIFPFCPKF